MQKDQLCTVPQNKLDLANTLSSKKKQKSTLSSVAHVKGESKERKMPLEQITGK